jgi:hypothetical protein
MPLINLSGDSLAWATIASASMAMILYGYDQGVMSYAQKIFFLMIYLTCE